MPINPNKIKTVTFKKSGFLKMRETRHHNGPSEVIDGGYQSEHDFENKNVLSHYFTYLLTDHELDTLLDQPHLRGE